MNDIMLNAYQDHTFAQAREDMPLLGSILEDWRATRTLEQEALASIITAIVVGARGISRTQLWERIVTVYFMQYREAEFRDAVQALVSAGTIACDEPTRRLNGESILCAAPKRGPASAPGESFMRFSS